MRPVRLCISTVAQAAGLAFFGAAAPAFGAEASAPAAAPAPVWELSFAPYFWGIGFEGTASARGVETDFDVDFSDLIDDLEFAFLGSAEARRGRLSLAGNLTYMKLAPESHHAIGSVLPSAPPGSFRVESVLDSVIVEGVVGYEVARTSLAGDDARPLALDLRAGFRAWWSETYLNVELEPGSPLGPFRREVEESDGWADFVVGARVSARPTEKLGLVLSGDVGGFDIGSSSKLTWSVAAFVTYQTGEHWTLGVGWRGIDVDRKGTELRTSGPLIGGIYRF